jgi:hypothetical protein
MLGIYFVVASVGSAAVTGIFAYLKYRSYVGLAKHVVDTLGTDGLSELGVVDPPAHGLQNRSPREAASEVGQQLRPRPGRNSKRRR